MIENIKKTFFSVKLNAMIALPIAACAILFYPFFYGEPYAALLMVVMLIALTLININRLRISNEIIKILLVMVVLIVMMFYSFDSIPIKTFEAYVNPSYAYIPNMLTSAVICFFVFLVGYAYSLSVNNALGVIRYVFLYQLMVVYSYVSLIHGFNVDYSLLQGMVPVVLLPYIYLVFSNHKNGMRIIFTILLICYLYLISSRTSLLAVILFAFTYLCYPNICRRRYLYNFYFISFFIILILLQYLYISGFFDFLAEFTRDISGKSLNSGRNYIWVELLRYISDRPYLGYGNNQNSSYLISSYASWRNLSSHNMYLEILLRGGLLLLVMVVGLFFMIWKSFHSYSNNLYGRIGASALIAFLFLASGVEVGLTQNVVINGLAWLFFGIATGKTWMLNRKVYMNYV